MPSEPLIRTSIAQLADDELVERSIAGDANAFEELVRRHASAVYRAALAALRSAPDAEDVMQDTFVLAFEKLRSFRRESSFKTWLLTIAWRRALRRRGGLARRFRLFLRADDGMALAPAGGPSVEQTLIAGELYRDVRRLVRALPVRFRDPLLLAATGAYSYEELSDILGIPTGTVKWRISEARRLLRMKLARLASPGAPAVR